MRRRTSRAVQRRLTEGMAIMCSARRPTSKRACAEHTSPHARIYHPISAASIQESRYRARAGLGKRGDGSVLDDRGDRWRQYGRQLASHAEANVRAGKSGGCAEQGVGGAILSGDRCNGGANRRAARESTGELTGIRSVADERQLVDDELERRERADAGNDVGPRDRACRLAQLTVVPYRYPPRRCRDAEERACAGRSGEKNGRDSWWGKKRWQRHLCRSRRATLRSCGGAGGRSS